MSGSQILNFIRASLLSAYLNDEIELDEKQKEFLSGLKPSELVELAKQDPGLVASAVNLVPTELVSQVFVLMDSETVGKVLHLSGQFKVQNFISQFASFEAKIQALREASKVTLVPVLESTEVLLTQVGPDKEIYLFEALLSSKAFVMVEELSKRYFPADLVLKLGPDKINSILLRMSLGKRAELICSLGDTDKAIVLSALGEKGKMRELIDSEVESIMADEGRKKSIANNRLVIWKQFVDIVRQNVQSNPMVQENAQEVLKIWIDEKKNGKKEAQAA